VRYHYTGLAGEAAIVTTGTVIASGASAGEIIAGIEGICIIYGSA